MRCVTSRRLLISIFTLAAFSLSPRRSVHWPRRSAMHLFCTQLQRRGIGVSGRSPRFGGAIRAPPPGPPVGGPILLLRVPLLPLFLTHIRPLSRGIGLIVVGRCGNEGPAKSRHSNIFLFFIHAWYEVLAASFTSFLQESASQLGGWVCNLCG